MSKKKLNLKMSLGDAVDRLTILSLKIYYGEEAAISEHRYIEKGLDEAGYNGKLITNVIRLGAMNQMIWNLENEIRRHGTDKFTLEEIGKRAVKIRDFNRKRVQYKNAISKMSKDYTEYKINHRSQ